jgi:hypothetical protein
MATSSKCHDHEERSLEDENALQAPNDEHYSQIILMLALVN